jgi:ubiquinone/menaquinone biosynthesis C-methylase UbiE
MNSRHSKVTDWGLSNISVNPREIILDVGCGGGKTVSKLAAMAIAGKVYGLDFSDVSVSVARKLNDPSIKQGRVEIHEGTVSDLPFPANTFDLVTAVETHFWWPDLPTGMREILRVLKPGGTFVIIAEVYKGAQTTTARLIEKSVAATGMKFLTTEEHRELLVNTGYSNVRIIEQSNKGWICCIGNKPA